MICPRCDEKATVDYTRQKPGHVFRRYSCSNPRCGHEFGSREAIVGAESTDSRISVTELADFFAEHGIVLDRWQ